jgi:hypothetical protein
VAHNSHKRETNARRMPSLGLPSLGKHGVAKIAAPLAVFATLATVTTGVLTTDSNAPEQLSANQASFTQLTRDAEVSRSSARTGISNVTVGVALSRQATLAATRAAIRNATKHLWTAAELNLWASTDPKAKLLGTVDGGKKVLVTGRRADGRAEIVVKGQARWVTALYLSADKPLAAAGGISMAPCPDGSVENGLTSGAVRVYRTVCHAFPQVTTYGGWDAHGEHSSGRALDIMVSDSGLGQAIADFLVAHAAELNLFDVLWQQHIWTPVRASEGWRAMSDRGSATANHYDHVHVSVN